jgi:hypothetical protein
MVAAISNRIDFFFIRKQNIFAKIRISERNTKDMGVKEVKEVKKLCELRELTIRIFLRFPLNFVSKSLNLVFNPLNLV